MTNRMRAALCGCALAGMLTAAGAAGGALASETVQWDIGTWTVEGSGTEAVYTAPEKNFLSGITTKEALAFNCIEFDIRALDTYGSVDGNVGLCYTCGDVEYFFELNTVNNYLRVRRMTPTETFKTSTTGFTLRRDKWYHFKMILAPDLLRWYIDGEIVADCRDTSECSMDKGVFLIQGYNAQPQVKNIVFSNEEISLKKLDFEFESSDASDMFTWQSFDGSAGENANAKVEDGEYIWPLDGSITSYYLDTAPGDRYSMKLPLRNTFCVRMKNDSDAAKLRLYFITEDDETYDTAKSKVFDIQPRTGYFTYYFNISDVEGAEGYLRGFKLEAEDVREGTVYIDAITFEREAKIYDYAGSVDSCRTDGTEIIVTGSLKPEYADKKVILYETALSNCNFSKSGMKKIGEAQADGQTFTVRVPLMENKITRIPYHFFAEVDGVFVSPWFTVENYYEFSGNPYYFDIPMNLEVIVTDSPYNACGDGFTNDTVPIQKAIDAVSAAGGGKVIIPGDDSEYGKRYIVTGLQLKSNVWLYLDSGAVLWQSPRAEEYPYEPATGHDVSIPGVNWTHAGLCHNYPFVLAKDAQNVKITGKGMLRLNDVGSECDDGVNGSTIWTGCEGRIHLIALALVNCQNVQVSGITIHRANCYHFNMSACSRVYVSDITMNEATCASGDGIGLGTGTHDVKIDRCFLYSNDDAVTLTSSYNDPRGLVWWRARPEQDNSVRNVEVCHCDLFGGHGLTFITWGSDNPDLSKQEIYNVRAYDNILNGACSVGTWCDNPYYGGPFTNTETDDYSPVRDVRIYKNLYRAECTLLSVPPTNMVTDCGINSASDFQNGDFERRNGKKGWVSGLTNWSCLGGRSNLAACSETVNGRENHFATVSGDTFMYQGLYFKKGTVGVEFEYKAAGGDAEFLVVDAESGMVLARETLKDTGAAADNSGASAYRSFSWSGALKKGTYLIGVRTAEGVSVCADNFKASLASYDSALEVVAADNAEVISELVWNTDVLVVPETVNEILNPRYIAETLPREDRTPVEVEPIDGEQDDVKSAEKLSKGAKAAIIGGAAVLASAAGVAAAVLVGKKRRKKQG